MNRQFADVYDKL